MPSFLGEDVLVEYRDAIRCDTIR